MAKTSLNNYTVAAIVVGAIMATYALAYLQADVNYDIGDINGSELDIFADYDDILQNVNQSTSDSYDKVATDRSLFDVIGGLIVDAITAVRTFIQGLTFLSESTRAMLSSNYFLVPFTIVSAVIAIIAVRIAIYFLVKIVAGKEDEL